MRFLLEKLGFALLESHQLAKTFKLHGKVHSFGGSAKRTKVCFVVCSTSSDKRISQSRGRETKPNRTQQREFIHGTLPSIAETVSGSCCVDFIFLCSEKDEKKTPHCTPMVLGGTSRAATAVPGAWRGGVQPVSATTIRQPTEPSRRTQRAGSVQFHRKPFHGMYQMMIDHKICVYT